MSAPWLAARVQPIWEGSIPNSSAIGPDMAIRRVRKATEGVERGAPGALAGTDQSEATELGDDGFGLGCCVHSALHRSEGPADVLLQLVNEAPNDARSCSTTAGRMPSRTRRQSRSVMRSGKCGEGAKRPGLLGAMAAAWAGRLNDQDRPFFGEARF